VEWLENRVIQNAQGARIDRTESEPRSTFWLGRLAGEEATQLSAFGKRAEKLDPCAIGMRLRPQTEGPWEMVLSARFVGWIKHGKDDYRKTDPIDLAIPVLIDAVSGPFSFGLDLFDAELKAQGLQTHGAEFRVEVEEWREPKELVISLVNVTPNDPDSSEDVHLYEAVLKVSGLNTRPFELEAVPDSFRYDRLMPAIGLNCGIDVDGRDFQTNDVVRATKRRPEYWNVDSPEPNLDFATMASNPIPQLVSLLAALELWGEENWSEARLASRGSNWSVEMANEAKIASEAFRSEVERIQLGLKCLTEDDNLLVAFKAASAAVLHAAAGKYRRWRPFQIGFLLGALVGIVDPSDSDTVDTVWFATGGGKTETYLGLLVTAIIYDRLSGKAHGISAWSRFPLRMLSLQQTQRFADVLAGAELERIRLNIAGSPISLGFFVGGSSTPNKIDDGASGFGENADDPTMPARFQVLLRCPFCRDDGLYMEFDRKSWTLGHRCPNPECPWGNSALPFYIVDSEIYRFLPSVVVGTLDKAASVSMQGAMRGLYGPPLARCDKPGHGYCYGVRSKSPSGCLVPGCRGSRQLLGQSDGQLWSPRLRLQDELHLLRDSLGAVDSHYESLFDHLQKASGGSRAKVIASSATLTGFERQTDVLYLRKARVFPLPGPSEDESFWSQPGPDFARRYVAIAPRGVTMEFVSDRTLETLQTVIRHLVDHPEEGAAEIGIPVAHIDYIVNQYGVNVVYGNNRRDVEAARRSADTQFPFPVNSCSLTGGTPFSEIRDTLDRLDKPEADFNERVHVVAASSMISHGVDVDRLNTMIMLGLPLTTAEFIQTSARVGRRWPGLVFVLHRLTREREVATYAQFQKFVTQGDRFVEPIPITRSSRRVLALTIPGVVEARRLGVHEPKSAKGLTTIGALRDYHRAAGTTAESEADQVIEALGIDGPLDDRLRDDVQGWMATYFDNMFDPATTAKWPSDLSPSSHPMISLRDVEEGVPVVGDDR
jgi:hypothetical protein